MKKIILLALLSLNVNAGVILLDSHLECKNSMILKELKTIIKEEVGLYSRGMILKSEKIDGDMLLCEGYTHVEERLAHVVYFAVKASSVHPSTIALKDRGIRNKEDAYKVEVCSLK